MTKQIRDQARRAALRVLYAADVADDDTDEVLENARQALIEQGEDPSEYWDPVVGRVRAVLDDQERIDAEIRALSTNWRLERMAAVDRNLLRLGIFELLEGLAPPLVTINACVELAKEFGTASTPGFINGLLDQLCQDHDIPLKSADRRSD